MNIQNLQFFDKFGKNLNLDFNLEGNFWEGTIYFPELSVYLFDNENIFILEKIPPFCSFQSKKPNLLQYKYEKPL